MLRIVIYALPLVLAVYALIDLVQTKDTDVQGLPKLVWVLLIVFVWVVGPIAWLIAGRRGRRFPGLAPRTAGPTGGPYRPMAPDDDVDFLRGLNPPPPPPPPSTNKPDDEA